MSPTRRRRVLTTRSRLTVGTAVLAVVAGGGMVTRTVASAASAPGQQAVVCTPRQDAAAQPKSDSHSAHSSRQPSQRLSPGAQWLRQRGEVVDRHGVHNVWGDGQDAPDAAASGAAAPAAAAAAAGAPAAAAASEAGACSPAPAPGASAGAGPGASPAGAPAASPGAGPAGSPAAGAPPAPAAGPAASPAAPLEILGNSCKDSGLTGHTGFQDGDRCVSTAFGEVATADKNPSLLITSAPNAVRVNEFFDLKVSTRNLVRDRFLKAAQGGYYKESSFLTAEGLVRGHFHTACRMLATTQAAPDPAPAPAFFVATEDGKGGAEPDTVTIRVLGMPQRGLAQCAVWAGDGSHRVPMMQRANQVPAFDVVRIRVR